MKTDPFISLLSALGDPMTSDNLKRMLRRELISTIDLDWTTILPSLGEKLKALSSISTASRDPNWHARISELLQSAANKTMENISKDPFVRLAREIGLTMKVVDLQRTFSKQWLGYYAYDAWLDVPREVREQVEEDILSNMVLPEKPSEKIECRRRVKALINEAGKKSWFLMKRRKNEIRRKKETKKANQDDSCSGGAVVLGEEGRKKRKRGVEGLQNDANSEEKGGIPKRKGVRGRPRGCLWEQLGKDEEIGLPPQIGPDKEEKGGVQTDKEIDDTEDVTHEQGGAHVLKVEETEAGNKEETAEIDSVIQSSEAAEAILQGGETNEVGEVEGGQEVIVLSSDDEQPRKVERVGKIMQVIDLQSEDERSFSQPEESGAPDFDYFGL